jgi:hypothetical protein
MSENCSDAEGINNHGTTTEVCPNSAITGGNRKALPTDALEVNLIKLMPKVNKNSSEIMVI